MKDLLWHEPAKYRRAKYNQMEKANPLKSLQFAGLAFVIIMALRGLAGMSPRPDRHPPDWGISAAIALGVAVFAAYLLPRFVGLFANSIVILSDKGVNNNSVHGGATVRFWPWDKIAFCYAWTEQLNGEAYRVLSFCDRNSVVLTTLCLDKPERMREVEAALAANRIPMQYENGTSRQKF